MEQVKTQVNELGKRRKIVAKPNKGSVLSCDDLYDLETIDSMKKSLTELMPVIRYIGAGSKAKHTDEQYIAALQDQSYHSQVKCHGGSGENSPLQICWALVLWGFPGFVPPVWFGGFGSIGILVPVSWIQYPWLTIRGLRSRIRI